VAVGVAMAGLLAGPAAQAQVPAIPDAPEVPPEVTAALEQVEDLVIPVLVDGAIQAQAVSNALGFGLRPACAGAGTAVLLVVIAGGSLPVSPGFISTPLLIFCAGAFSPGPADPVFDIVDEQAGSTLASNVNPVLKQLRDALAPVRPNTTDACGVIALAGSTPRQVPPPLNRFNLVRLVC
jgi:hypothetical protein